MISTLLTLAKAALKKSSVSLIKPLYPDDPLADEAAVDDDAILGEVEDGISDLVNRAVNEEEYYGESTNRQLEDGTNESDDFEGAKIHNCN